jgi:hypothetical protein
MTRPPVSAGFCQAHGRAFGAVKVAAGADDLVLGGVVVERQQLVQVTGDLRGCLWELGAVGRAGLRQAGFPAAGRNAASPRTRSWNSFENL